MSSCDFVDNGGGFFTLRGEYIVSCDWDEGIHSGSNVAVVSEGEGNACF